MWLVNSCGHLPCLRPLFPGPEPEERLCLAERSGLLHLMVQRFTVGFWRHPFVHSSKPQSIMAYFKVNHIRVHNPSTLRIHVDDSSYVSSKSLSRDLMARPDIKGLQHGGTLIGRGLGACR